MLIETIIGLLSGLGGVIGGIAALWGIISKPTTALKARVQRIEDEQLKELRDDLKAHIAADKSQRILALLENIQGCLVQMGVKLDNLTADTARNTACIEADRKYIENVDSALERHRNASK